MLFAIYYTAQQRDKLQNIKIRSCLYIQSPSPQKTLKCISTQISCALRLTKGRRRRKKKKQSKCLSCSFFYPKEFCSKNFFEKRKRNKNKTRGYIISIAQGRSIHSMKEIPNHWFKRIERKKKDKQKISCCCHWDRPLSCVDTHSKNVSENSNLIDIYDGPTRQCTYILTTAAGVVYYK